MTTTRKLANGTNVELPDFVAGYLDYSRERDAREGREVRCPKCNAGIGKACIGEPHAERVALQNEAR